MVRQLTVVEITTYVDDTTRVCILEALRKQRDETNTECQLRQCEVNSLDTRITTLQRERAKLVEGQDTRLLLLERLKDTIVKF